MSMKDPLIEWLVATTPLKRDIWILECQLYRILRSYINGCIDENLVKSCFEFVKKYMINHSHEHCYEEKSLGKMLIVDCCWSVDMFVNMIKEKKCRI